MEKYNKLLCEFKYSLKDKTSTKHTFTLIIKQILICLILVSLIIISLPIIENNINDSFAYLGKENAYVSCFNCSTDNKNAIETKMNGFETLKQLDSFVETSALISQQALFSLFYTQENSTIVNLMIYDDYSQSTYLGDFSFLFINEDIQGIILPYEVIMKEFGYCAEDILGKELNISFPRADTTKKIKIKGIVQKNKTNFIFGEQRIIKNNPSFIDKNLLSDVDVFKIPNTTTTYRASFDHNLTYDEHIKIEKMVVDVFITVESFIQTYNRYMDSSDTFMSFLMVITASVCVLSILLITIVIILSCEKSKNKTKMKCLLGQTRFSMWLNDFLSFYTIYLICAAISLFITIILKVIIENCSFLRLGEFSSIFFVYMIISIGMLLYYTIISLYTLRFCKPKIS